MNPYLAIALKGFVLFSSLSFLDWVLGSGVPWEDQKTVIMLTYFGISGAYLPSCSGFLSDLFSGETLSVDRPTRYIFILLAGASMGLFLLGWNAVINPNGLETLYREQFQRLLCGGPLPLMEQARALVPKAELLGTFKMIIEESDSYLISFAVLSIANFWVYDVFRRQRAQWIVLASLRFLIPCLVLMRIMIVYSDLSNRFIREP